MSDDFNKTKRPGHDFLLDRKWLVDLMGCGQSRSFLYIAYVVSIYSYFIYICTMAAYGMVLAAPEKNLIVSALHVMMNCTFILWGISTRHATRKALDKIRYYIHSGFYKYEGENLTEEQIKLRDGVADDIRSRSQTFIYIYIAGGLTNALFLPLTQAFIVTEEQYERIVDIANPYLPAFFYIPFSTRSVGGFALAYGIALFIPFLVDGAAIVLNEICVSCVLQLLIQLQILNLSIRNIHQRASRMYAGLHNNFQIETALDHIYGDKGYQECLNRCLRSNIEHHQLLLRFQGELRKYIGSFLLMLCLIASITFAANIYIVLQNPVWNILTNCLITFLVEQTYVMYLCMFGERIMNESGNLFESLYSIPWFYYSKTFNQTLRVFMCNVRKPITSKAFLFNITASFETYADFFSVMYKIVNLLKQSDTI